MRAGYGRDPPGIIDVDDHEIMPRRGSLNKSPEFNGLNLVIRILVSSIKPSNQGMPGML